MFSRLLVSVRPVGLHLAKRSFADAAGGTGMKFTFACPAQVFYAEAPVRQVDVPSMSGNFGILPHHVPVLACLKPGVVTVFDEKGEQKKYFVSSGTITVNEDSSVQVLAEEACLLENVDLAACREGLAQAQRDVSSAADGRPRAEAQISVEVHEALLKAAETGA